MSVDLIERLARANPVRELPTVAPPETVYALLERDEAPAPAQQRRRRRVPRLAVAVALAPALALVALLLSAGSPDRGVNVLAAVYAATAPRGGIVETVSVTRTYRGGGRVRAVRLQEWSDSEKDVKRGLSTVLGPGKAELDVVYSPRTWETWSNAGGAGLLRWGTGPAGNVVHRIVWSHGDEPDVSRMGFQGSGTIGSSFAPFFRALYRHGGWRVVGHESRGGHLYWKLEGSAAQVRERAREDGTRFYVLVDPHTFLPVYVHLIELAKGAAGSYESELLSSTTLPSTPQNQGIFDLAAQHPGAPVKTEAAPRH